MSTLHIISNGNAPFTKGLAPVSCYDPYYGRMAQSLRKVLADGHPALIRLHCAADYPASNQNLYKNDLEGHAVMVIGYDDERDAFAIADPWDPSWGGSKGGIRWIGYHELSMIIVDASMGYGTILSPLEVKAEEKSIERGRVLELEVGYYALEAIVMDRNNQEIHEISVVLSGAMSSKQTITGVWTVGQKAFMRFDVSPETKGEIIIEASAIVAGSRPYLYKDKIEIKISKMIGEERLSIRKVA